MKRLSTLIVLATFLVALGTAQPAQTNNSPVFGNPFATVENFVEKAEVGLAGVIGGPDLKAKALANNAEETLAKAERLAKNNKTERAAKMAEKYNKNINRSRELAAKGGDENLTRQLDNISSQNVQRLEEVKKKVPEEAQKGIQNAIENSKRSEKARKPDREGVGKGSSGEINNSRPGKPTNSSVSKIPEGTQNKNRSTISENNLLDERGNLTDNDTRRPQVTENDSEAGEIGKTEDSGSSTNGDVDGPVEDSDTSEDTSENLEGNQPPEIP